MMISAVRPSPVPRRAAIALAVVTPLLTLWIEGGVGINGPSHPRSLVCQLAVIAVGLVGAVVARFQPRGMAWALLATAGAQAIAAGIALATGMHHLPGASVAEILGIHGFFAVLFLVSAALFRVAARGAVVDHHLTPTSE